MRKKVCYILTLLLLTVLLNAQENKNSEVIFYRASVLASPLNIVFDDMVYEGIENNQYISILVEPGEKIFFCYQNSAFGNSNYQLDAILINAVPNEKYYVELTQNYGYANLELRDNSVGENKISKMEKK